ncbi:MAG: ABC transporter ATP-binding protein [Syntrophorhabdales bacterium]|jgi:branched-chain amino acid transport system ATP-binding protein
MLAVDNLTKFFKGLTALGSLSFEVGESEIVGLIGPNGAGKSTTFEIISGFQRPTTGQVMFNGERIDRLEPHDIVKRGISRSFQLSEAVPHFTAFDFLLVSALSKMGMREARQRTTETLEMIGFTGKGDYPLSVLGAAERKRAELGVVFNSRPHLALLDEPFAGLGEDDTEWLRGLIRKSNREGMSFLMVEHRIQYIKDLCHRIVVLHLGQKIAEGTADEIMTNKDVIDVYFGGEE